MSYNQVEMMVVAASRILEDKKTVFVGTGIPLLAAVLAQKTHAKDLLIIFEAGGIGGDIPRLPLSVGDSYTFHRAIAAVSLDYVMSLAQAGYIDYGFIGGAQIDPYGNLNTTVVGNWERPRVRLPGSGGGNDIASFCWKTIVVMKQDRTKFVNKVDFITSPGYIDENGRENVGLPCCTGPLRVVTQLGIYDFNPSTRRMRLIELFPGTTIDDVRENSEFEVEVSSGLKISQPPSADEIDIIRRLDEQGIVIGK